MKINKILLLSLLLLSSCKGGTSSSFDEVKDIYSPSFTYEENNDKALELDVEEREMYENKFLDDRITNQWPSYGIGDPFIYRFNGKYYLYCSTKDNYVGVKAWVSDDLMNWDLVKAEGLEEGFVCKDDTTVSSYAPEVIYRDGYFYMCQSSAGNGHYLYKAEKPEGPFVRISDNIQESIDGSFFIDDDEEMYFLRASDKGIVIKKFNDNFEFVDDKVIAASYMNGWTEGPYLLKRDDMYYLTYTGNHIMSNAYRVSYSYATEDEFSNDYTFNKGNVLLLNTDEDFKGLGHSSTVMGPDLDSYYVAYHNLINTIPTRNFNLARLSFNGSNMVVDSCSIENNFVPRLPKFASENKEGLNKEGNKYLNNIVSSDIYSAEYNFIGDNANLYFSYVDENNYNYINLLNNKISVYQVENNKETLLNSITLNREYDYTKLHTIRIAYNETLDIYFDNCRKINDLEIKNNNGYIGYSDNVDIYYTALSDVAKFSSDSKEIHQNNISLEDYVYSNKEVKFGEGMYKNSKSVILENKDDTIAYQIYNDEDCCYNFDLLFKKEYSGKKIKIRIDDNDNIIATLPSIKDVNSDYIKATIFNENLKEGIHTLSITCIDKVEIMELGFNKVNETAIEHIYKTEEGITARSA